MWQLILAAMLAFTVLSDANINCPISKQCSCTSNTVGDQSDIECHEKENNRTNMLIVHIVINESTVFQCGPTMAFTDYELLTGLSIGPVKSVVTQFCPLPNMPFSKFFQNFNTTGLKQLGIRHYNVSNTLDRTQFSELPNLTSLSINNCGISGIPADIFRDFMDLKSLDLRDNELQILPRHVFDHLSNLEVLELGSNSISHLENGIFQNLTKLRVLNLWSNKLQNLSRNVFTGLSNLEIIDLSTNSLRTLPADVFADIPQLKEVAMYSNHIMSLPEGLFSSLHRLRKYKLYDNREQLEELPSGFLSNLTNLEEVYLNKCGLKHLPENAFWGSTEIKNLSLQENVFSTLPEKLLRDLNKIETLDLSYNQLEELPDGLFSNQQGLKYLRLGHNRLTNISNNLFKSLVNLIRLDLEHNELKEVGMYSFLKMHNLVYLQLSHNRLRNLNGLPHYPQSVLRECTKLEELYLAYNNISFIYEDWIYVTHNLRTIDLSHNAIPFISDRELHFLSSTVSVDLTYNNISHVVIQINPSLYTDEESSKLKSQRRVLLEGNPIMCDCVLYNLLQYKDGKLDQSYYDEYTIVTGNLTCAGPADLKGVSVEKLKAEKFECSLSAEEICPQPCVCQMQPFTSALKVYCNKMQLSEVPRIPSLEDVNIKQNSSRMKMNHIELLLNNNRIVKLPQNKSPGFEQVTKLYLSNNNISTLSGDDLPEHIQELELHNNRLEYLNDSVVTKLVSSSDLKRVTLHGNPWHCDCDARGFLTFLQEHYSQVSQLSDIICSDNSGRALRNLTITELCPDSNTVVIAASIAVACLGIIIGVILALYYYYHHEVKVWLFAHEWFLWFVTEEEVDKDKLYDAFISYSHRDEDFVVNQLVPVLESGSTPFKLCLHYRDWIAGELIPNQIARSVDDSRRTLVVLSPSFLESVWGRMEFRTAHKQALSEGRARVIVLLYGDIGSIDQLDPELKAYLTMNTYVKWGDPWFWNKLRYALPHPQNRMKKKGMELRPCKKTIDDKLELINPSTPPAATTPPTDAIKNPLEAAKTPLSPATNGHATLISEANGHVNKCFA